MGLRDLFIEFASSYPQAKTEMFKGHPVSILMRKTITSEIESSGIFDQKGYKVWASVGKGGWAEIPWAAIFDLSLTDTLHHGIFVLYVFSADMQTLYLTVNQGSVTYFDQHSRKETNEHLKIIAESLIGTVDCNGFKTGPIDLKATSSVGRFLEIGCIFSIRYDINDLPDDDVLIADLKRAHTLCTETIDTAGQLGLDLAIPEKTP